jgi:hypothetical protein
LDPVILLHSFKTLHIFFPFNVRKQVSHTRARARTHTHTHTHHTRTRTRARARARTHHTHTYRQSTNLYIDNFSKAAVNLAISRQIPV